MPATPTMPTPPRRPTGRGFTRADLLALLVVAVLLAALLVLVMPRQRAMGQLSGSMANLRELGTAFHSYGLDNADRVATFSWRKGDMSSQWVDLRNATSDYQAASLQAADIIRRRKPYTPAEFPRFNNWLANVSYSHLVLLDYLDAQAPWWKVVSPGDQYQVDWAKNPDALPPSNGQRRWAFRSSYEMPAAYWSLPESGDTAPQMDTWGFWSIYDSMECGTRSLSEIVFPSNRAMLVERHQWYFGTPRGSYLHEQNRVPILAADGSAAVRGGRSVNKGWVPRDPLYPGPKLVEYKRSGPWDPPAYSSTGSDIVPGGIMFTRSGLGGRDFDGAEVPLP